MKEANISVTVPLRRPENTEHLLWLDGLRGVAALWVLLHHVFILVGGHRVPFLSWGSLAVDLFMMLSGFLMAHHYILRRDHQPWAEPSTWTYFWTKRFFRIAPLYYLLLVVALAIGPWLYVQREAIASVWPATATTPDRYQDNSLSNAMMHFSFLFGLIPDYSFRSPLPDWSIGLEMQFYAVFPLLMLVFGRFGFLRSGGLLVGICLALGLLIPGFFAAFPLPSFLPAKMYVFLIGIWLAVGLARGELRKYFIASLVLACIAFLGERSFESIGRILIATALFYLADARQLFLGRRVVPVIDRIKSWLSGRLASFMGDTSYGVYLLHLLLVLPVLGWLVSIPAFVEAGVWARLGIGACLVIPPTYLGAWVLYRWIERPGIDMGRRINSLRKLERRPVEQLK